MITITISGLDTASAAMRAAVKSGVRGGLGVAGARGQALVQHNIVTPYLGRPNAVASGNLANAITFVLNSLGNEVDIIAGAPADVYADYVEGGTGPHFPPIPALILWVNQKLRPADAHAAESIAYAIAWTIRKRGTLAFGMFARAFPVLEGELQGIFEAAIADGISKAGLA